MNAFLKLSRFMSGKSAKEKKTDTEGKEEVVVEKVKEEEDAQMRLRSLMDDDDGGNESTTKESGAETTDDVKEAHQDERMNAGETILFSTDDTTDHSKSSHSSENGNGNMVVNIETQPSAPATKPTHQSNGYRSPRVKKMDTNHNNTSSDEKIRRYKKAGIPDAAKMVTRNKKILRGMEERAFEKAMDLFMRRVENAPIQDRNMAKSIVLKRAQEHNISDDVIARIFDNNTQQTDTRLASTLEDD